MRTPKEVLGPDELSECQTLTPPPPPPQAKVVGKFLALASEAKYEEAVQNLKFSKVSLVFREKGVARNESNTACSQLLSDLLEKPVVNSIMAEETSDSDFARLNSLTTEWRTVAEPFFGDRRFGGVLERLATVAIMSQVAAHGTSKEATPSVVRRALSFMEGLGTRTQVYLAMKHGKVGKAISSACELVVQQNQHDNVGNDLMAKATVVIEVWVIAANCLAPSWVVLTCQVHDRFRGLALSSNVVFLIGWAGSGGDPLAVLGRQNIAAMQVTRGAHRRQELHQQGLGCCPPFLIVPRSTLPEPTCPR